MHNSGVPSIYHKIAIPPTRKTGTASLDTAFSGNSPVCIALWPVSEIFAILFDIICLDIYPVAVYFVSGRNAILIAGAVFAIVSLRNVFPASLIATKALGIPSLFALFSALLL
ncbi:MAG: hypothetical protein R6X08_04360 [Desulfosalsimonadaceae bacterium]